MAAQAIIANAADFRAIFPPDETTLDSCTLFISASKLEKDVTFQTNRRCEHQTEVIAASYRQTATRAA
jgi:hypothetical protein